MPALTSRQHGQLVGLVLFGTVLIAYVASLLASQLNTDALANSFAAWHLAHSGSPFFDNTRLIEINGGPEYFGTNADGHVVISRTPGQIWAAVPFYVLLTDDNFAHFSSRAGTIAASFWSAVAVLCYYLSLRSRLPMLGAIGGTAVLAFTTPVWAVSAESLWPHAVTVLGIAGAGWAASRERWGWAGFFFGVGILARPHVAVIAAVVGIGVSLSRRSVRPAAMVALFSGALMALLVAWNRYVFGDWSVVGGYPQDLADVIPGHRESRLGDGYLTQVAGTLLSPNRGFLVWTPLVLVLLPLVWRNRGRLPAWSLWMALGGIAYSVIQSAINEWTGGSGFNSYRLMLELLLCIAPVGAFAAAYAGPLVRRLAPYVVGYQLAVISVATLTDDALGEDDFWTDSTVLVGLREQTLLTTALLVGFGLVGWWATRLVISRLVAGYVDPPAKVTVGGP